MHSSSLLACAGLALLAAPPLGAAQHQDPIADALSAWNARTGRIWRLDTEPQLGGMGRFLWGAQAEASFTPETDADWFELARRAFDEAYGIFGVADATLAPVGVKYLNLAQIGTTDKVAVELAQIVRGVAVRGGTVHALFTPSGDLLALDSNALPGVERLDTRPVANRWEAVSAARGWFAGQEGREAVSTGEPELTILRHSDGGALEARLAWAVELRNETDLSHPSGRRVYVAADRKDGTVLSADQLVHRQQISGHVEAWATPGSAAGSGSNPPTIHSMPYLTLTSPGGSVTTDANGDFSVPSAVAATLTAKFTGPYCRVDNNGGPDHSVSQSFTPGVPATLTMNPNQTEFATSEASCFDSVIDVRNWLLAVDPTETTLDFQILANANINFFCNAFYNGNSINMFRAGGGCNNTGYSTVVAHEEGHWMMDLYGSGNGPDGFGEGNADVVGMYVYDTPIVGDDFFTNGGFIRTGLNTRQFCGDTNIGCYGEVHNDGEVLMGALWKVRHRMNVSLGNAAGDATSDALWVA